MSSDLSLSSFERQEQIIKIVGSKNRITVSQICSLFNISEATARRDLDVLAEQGRIQRVHGGAIAAAKAPPELPVYQRMSEQVDNKLRIAKAAAELVKDGETVFLGSGTTVLEVARNLTNRKGLTIITNSLLVINTLINFPDINLIDLGGMLRRSEMSLLGHITEHSLAEVRADKVIMGIRGVDPQQGLTNDYLPETMTDRAILNVGRDVIVVADHTKCGRIATAFVASITSMHTLVTDNEIPLEIETALLEKGIHLIKA